MMRARGANPGSVALRRRKPPPCGGGFGSFLGGSEAIATAIRPTKCYMIAKNGALSPDRIAAPLAATVGSAR